VTEARPGIDARPLYENPMPPVAMSVWISYGGSPHALTNDGRSRTRCHWRLIRVNVMNVRENKALRIVGQTLLVLLALATMIGGWIVIGTG